MKRKKSSSTSTIFGIPAFRSDFVAIAPLPFIHQKVKALELKDHSLSQKKKGLIAQVPGDSSHDLLIP